MDLTSAILSCFCGSSETPKAPIPTQWHPTSFVINQQPSARHPIPSSESKALSDIEKISIDIVYVLRNAQSCYDGTLKTQIDDIVSTQGWSEWLAENVLKKLVDTLNKSRDKMGPAMARAYKDARDAANVEFEHLAREAKDHPMEIAATVFVSLLALGVLVALAPYVLEVLGFGELGPTAGELSDSLSFSTSIWHEAWLTNNLFFFPGSFASWWESTYGGFIPAGSLFSFFQRLGMIWRRV